MRKSTEYTNDLQNYQNIQSIIFFMIQCTIDKHLLLRFFLIIFIKILIFINISQVISIRRATYFNFNINPLTSHSFEFVKHQRFLTSTTVLEETVCRIDTVKVLLLQSVEISMVFVVIFHIRYYWKYVTLIIK